MSRLRTFLEWKDVRKNLKDDDEKGGAPDVPGDDVGGTVEETVEGRDGAVPKSVKRRGVALPWDISSFFSIQPPDPGLEENEEDNDDKTLVRLRLNDERTQDMSREEYAVWAECRQASFTWRKAKRFKEWANLGAVHDGGRVGDDVLDLLGFLCAEMVQVLGVEARRVLNEEDARSDAYTRQVGPNHKADKGVACQGLFVSVQGGRRAIQEGHVREANRRLQQTKYAKSRAFAGLGSGRMEGGRTLNLVGG